jgi:bifunctional oligoribonuclease and PAP phosphatase NrnA
MNQQQQKHLHSFGEQLLSHQRFIITTHTNPDADGIGSQIALCLALRALGKEAWCVNEKKLLDRYLYLDIQHVTMGVEEWKNLNITVGQKDALIIVDTHNIERTGSSIIENFKHLTNYALDHHPLQHAHDKNLFIDPLMSATGELVAQLIEQWESAGVNFNHDISLPLYTAILIDTSSFRYPTVTSNTHRIVAKLMQSGVSPVSAYNQIYGTKGLDHLRFIGHVLSKVQTDTQKHVAWLSVTRDDLENHSVDIEDTLSIINYLLVLDGVAIAAMFTEWGEKLTKVSLRSIKAEVDVGMIAKKMGGGGHGHSAAATLTLPLDQAVAFTLKTIEKLKVSSS